MQADYPSRHTAARRPHASYTTKPPIHNTKRMHLQGVVKIRLSVALKSLYCILVAYVLVV